MTFFTLTQPETAFFLSLIALLTCLIFGLFLYYEDLHPNPSKNKDIKNNYYKNKILYLLFLFVFLIISSVILYKFTPKIIVSTYHNNQSQFLAEISINTPFYKVDDNGKFYLMPTIKVNNKKNNGREDSSIYLKFNEESLKITKVDSNKNELDADVQISYQDTPDTHINGITTIKPLSNVKINYLAQLDEPGLYNIQFTADVINVNGETFEPKIFTSEYIQVK